MVSVFVQPLLSVSVKETGCSPTVLNVCEGFCNVEVAYPSKSHKKSVIVPFDQ